MTASGTETEYSFVKESLKVCDLLPVKIELGQLHALELAAYKMVFVDIEAVAAAALCKAFGDFAVLVQLEEVCIIIDSRDKIKITVHGLLRPRPAPYLASEPTEPLPMEAS